MMPWTVVMSLLWMRAVELALVLCIAMAVKGSNEVCGSAASEEPQLLVVRRLRSTHFYLV